jgi:ABC-2 type transport system ATP-binding protein
MLSVSHVSKTYRGYDIDHKESGFVLWFKNAFKLTANRATSVQALCDVSFEVAQGEVFGIYGANGAGKTTLIKVLSGLLLPDAGQVQVNGHCASSRNGSDRIKEQISYVSTNGWMGLEWQLTAYENVLLYGRLFGLPRATLRTRCDAALQRFGMFEARGKRISELSAGMRQKVTLARGFLLGRPILYLDEPTVSLDVPSAIALRDMLGGYVADTPEDPKTVLIASHSPEDLQICDRCLLLYRGRVLAVGTMDELRAPLSGIEALHLTCAGLDSGQAAEYLRRELLAVEGVRSVWSDAPGNGGPGSGPAGNGANGQGAVGQFRLLIHRELQPTGAIVDRFIARELPIVAMRTQDVTLQEIYQARLEATDAVQAAE